MRTMIFLLAFLLFSFGVSAEVYLLVDTTTDNIHSMSPENDAIPEEGQEVIIIPGDVMDYPLMYKPCFYKYKNNRLVVNVQKLSDKALRDEEDEKQIKEEKMIRKRMRKIAIDQLKGEGVEFEYIEENE